MNKGPKDVWVLFPRTLKQQKGLCRYESVKDHKMGKSSWVSKQVFARGMQWFRVREEDVMEVNARVI
jgi:hypothetical protein